MITHIAIKTNKVKEVLDQLDLYFEKLQNMPWWVTGLWISVVAAVYGIKATDIINTKKSK